MASGLMILLLNKATSFSNYFMKLPKEYIAVVKFGMETDSMDLEGDITNKTEVNELDDGKLEKIVKEFTGKINQVVPMYSAAKHMGRPLYKFARKGINIKREPRQVNIREIKIIKKFKDMLTLKIVCGSGTYIRSLAHDIGRSYGSGAVLSELRRTGIGDMEVISAAGIKDIKSLAKCKEIPEQGSWITGLYDFFSNYPSVYIKDDHIKKVRNGSRLSADMIDRKYYSRESITNNGNPFTGMLTVRSADGKIIAIHRMLQGSIKDNDIGSFDKDFTKSIVIF